jgi:hypothetical protein
MAGLIDCDAGITAGLALITDFATTVPAATAALK